MRFRRDYYHVLGVPPTAGQTEIKRAFRHLARRYHPDVSTDADAEARFKEVNEAYHVLGDPARRAAYDRFRRGYVTPGRRYPSPPAGPTPPAASPTPAPQPRHPRGPGGLGPGLSIALGLIALMFAAPVPVMAIISLRQHLPVGITDAEDFIDAAYAIATSVILLPLGVWLLWGGLRAASRTPGSRMWKLKVRAAQVVPGNGRSRLVIVLAIFIVFETLLRACLAAGR